jgi:murein DD-endopeptidase MepM/ murein hydrolase activator NlpD
MSTAPLSVGVEPSVGGAVVYEPVAPETAGGQAHGLLALRLALTDVGSQALHVNDIDVSFLGQPAVPSHSYATSLDINVGGQVVWNFARTDEIVLPSPAPAQVRLKVWADGYSAPLALTMPLKPHVSPVAGGSYLFPAHASDLRVGEYWSASAGTHDTGYQGSQLFAYDMGVVAYDAASQQWSYLLPGTDGTHNTDFRIWGKPLYAMAHGTVLEAVNNVPSNPHPLHWTSEADLQAQMKEQMDKYWGGFKNGGAGNHLYIQYGNEVVLVAHMQPGSIPAALLKPGAKVKAGQLLGLAGNSGNSTAPHTHIHAIQGKAPESGPLRPLIFHGIYVIDPSAVNPPSPAGPWVKDQGQALPLANAQGAPALVWPAASQPTWYPPGWAEVALHGIPEASYQAEFDKAVSSGYRPVWVDAYNVGGKTFFNVIFHPADGTPWVARHGLTGAGYQAEFDKWTKLGYRLALVDSYLSGGGIRYAAIFVKSGGPQWTAYHGLTAAQHQQRFNTLTAQGYVPVCITAVEVNGDRIYAALYEKRNVGSFVAHSFMTPAEYQTEFDANAKAGRQLVYLNAYTYNGAPRIIAIWEQKAPPVVAHHGMTSSGYQAEFDAELAQGLLVRAVAGYEENGQARFAAFWTK